MKWREVQQILIDADESATFISRTVYNIFCFNDGGSKSLLSSPLLSSPLFSEDSNLHHIAMTTWGRIKFNFFRNNPNRIFSFPKPPGQPWGPDRLLCYINWGRFSRRSSNQKREAGYSPPPSIALPSPTCLHGVYTDNVSDQSVEAYK